MQLYLTESTSYIMTLYIKREFSKIGEFYYENMEN